MIRARWVASVCVCSCLAFVLLAGCDAGETDSTAAGTVERDQPAVTPVDGDRPASAAAEAGDIGSSEAGRRADNSTSADTNTPAGAASSGNTQATLATGEAVLRGLPKLAVGTTKKYYYEVFAADNSVGYTTLSLTAVQREGQLLYEYVQEMAVWGAPNTRVLGDVRADLLPNFEPQYVENIRTWIGRDNIRARRANRTAVRADEVAMVLDEGEKKTLTKAARPTSPFVFGVEGLVQLIDFDRHPAFTLRVFDPQEGGTVDVTFISEVEADGTRRVMAQSTGAEPREGFRFDRDGHLQQWGESPVLCKRVTEERVVELKKKLRVEEDLAPAP